MKKNSILLFVLLFATLSIKAQTSDFFVGRWRIIVFYDSLSKPKTPQDSAQTFDNKYIVVFKSNKHFHEEFGAKRNGTWKYVENSKRLILKYSSGNEEEDMVVILAEDMFSLLLPDDRGITLQKIK